MTLLPLLLRSAGPVFFGPVVIPPGATMLRVALDRGAAVPGGTVRWDLELSVDGGTTWTPWGSSSASTAALLTGAGQSAQEHGLLALVDPSGAVHCGGHRAIPDGWSAAPGFGPDSAARRLRGRLEATVPGAFGLSLTLW